MDVLVFSNTRNKVDPNVKTTFGQVKVNGCVFEIVKKEPFMDGNPLTFCKLASSLLPDFYRSELPSKAYGPKQKDRKTYCANMRGFLSIYQIALDMALCLVFVEKLSFLFIIFIF